MSELENRLLAGVALVDQAGAALSDPELSPQQHARIRGSLRDLYATLVELATLAQSPDTDDPMAGT